MDFDYFEEKEKDVTETTISELDSRCNEYLKLKEELAKLKAQTKTLQDAKDTEERHIIDILSRSNKRNWAHNKGNFFIRTKIGVSMPSDPTHRDEFFNYLKEKNLFDSMITVNSQTLNAYYNAELAQIDEQNRKDFKIPGIAEASVRQDLAFNKR